MLWRISTASFDAGTKTQASFSSEESAVALLFGLIASGQIQLRRIDGYQRLSEVLKHAEVTASCAKTRPF